MTSSDIFLGIDGGGTHTRAVLVDRNGLLLGTGRGGASNYHSVGVDGARRGIADAVADAWRHARLEPALCKGAFLGMAGVIGRMDAGVVQSIARELGLAERIDVDHDIRTALAGGTGADEGIALIAGTGSSCYGRRDGRSWRAGGWGRLFDDVGGAYRVALDALHAVARALDGRGAETALTSAMLAELGVAGGDELPAALLGERGAHTAIAGLAPLVLETAAGGDDVAMEVVRSNADELALMVEAVAQRLGWMSDGRADDTLQLVAVGGIATTPFYHGLIIEQLTQRLRRNPVVPTLMPPVLGAALLALNHAGHFTPAIRARLAGSAGDKGLK